VRVEGGRINLRVGVIGAGSMGKKHARVYSSLTDYCQFVGVYDVDYDCAESVAKQYGVTAFASLDDLLSQVDAVTVAAPTLEHYAIGMNCISRNVHVLMEKPITQTEGQAKKLIRAAKGHGVLLQTGHIELFNPTIEVIGKLVEQEEIVSMEMRRLHRLEPRMFHVDVVSDTMIHDIYIMFHLLGKQVSRVNAVGKQVEGVNRYASALIKLKGGELAQLTASFLASETERTIRLTTKNDTITADLLNRTIQKASLIHSENTRIIPVPDADPLSREIIHFITCIKTKQRPLADGEDGLAALAMANKIIRIIQ